MVDYAQKRYKWGLFHQSEVGVASLPPLEGPFAILTGGRGDLLARIPSEAKVSEMASSP